MKKRMYLTLVPLLLTLWGCTSTEGDDMKTTPPGLVAGQLASCPSSPNCICSEYPEDVEHFSEPVTMSIDGQSAALLQQVAEAIGGKLQSKDDNYLGFTFTSRVFRFVDDFELRLDPEHDLVHIRSASRVGYSDLGVNRKRVERFKAALQAAQ